MPTAISAPPTVRISVQLGIAFFAFIFIGINDGVNGVLLPSYQQQYGLDKSGVSLLFFAGTLGYLLAALSSGPARDRLGLRVFLTLGNGAVLVGMTTLATAPPWQVVLGCIAVMGFGVGILDAGLNSYVAGLPDNSARLNYLHAFYGVGALLGPLLAAGILALAWPWNRVYAVLAATALLLILGLGGVFRGEPESSAPAAAPERNALAASLGLPIVWLGALFIGVYVGLEVSVGSWSYSYLTEQRGIATLPAGWMVSGYWLGLTAGRLVMAQATRRFGSRALIQVCLAGTVGGLLLLWLGPGSVSAALGMGLAGFCLGPLFPTLIAVISTVVPPRLLPSAIGFITSLGAGGAAFFPWVAGNLAEHIGLAAILPYAMVLAAVVLLCWLVLQRHLGATDDGQAPPLADSPALAPEE